MKKSKEELGYLGYTAYGDSVGWKNFQGNPMPSWSELPEVIRRAWCESSYAVYLQAFVPTPGEHKMCVVLERELEEDSPFGWYASVYDSAGEVLVLSLCDDMPETPGDALQSAGRMLDRELAVEAWNNYVKSLTAPGKK